MRTSSFEGVALAFDAAGREWLTRCHIHGATVAFHVARVR